MNASGRQSALTIGKDGAPPIDLALHAGLSCSLPDRLQAGQHNQQQSDKVDHIKDQLECLDDFERDHGAHVAALIKPDRSGSRPILKPSRKSNTNGAHATVIVHDAMAASSQPTTTLVCRGAVTLVDWRSKRMTDEPHGRRRERSSWQFPCSIPLTCFDFPPHHDPVADAANFRRN
ncbi:hypothetical protein [Bradyrhizobium macuxiense]|uniref:hypothetical protein n=1 Tax=Bradyrhizobium macuxiense TaxID=1755647 RepID=UPI0010A96C90|nr:hypothetical protein [Bradyrhizobium macuxiense]